MMARTCKQQDPEVYLVNVYRQYNVKIYDYALLLTQSPKDAEDIVQDVFIKFWMVRTQWDEISNPGGFLKQMTRNKCLDHFRQIKKAEENLKALSLFDTGQSNATKELIYINDYKKWLALAIERLPQKRRHIFILSRVMGMKRPTIARLLDISPHTVRVQINACLKILKKDLHLFMFDKETAK